MLLPYYSGAPTHLATQSDPYLSLGGYASNSLIPNALLNNLFPNTTRSHLQSLQIVTRMVIVRNTHSGTISNLRIFTNISDKFTYKIAAVTPAIIAGIPTFEKLSSPQSLPYQATFDIYIEDAPLVVTSLAANAYLGIWICKIIDPEKLSAIEMQDASTLTSKEIYEALLQANTSSTIDDFITIRYDL